MMLSNLNLSSLPECNFEVRYVDSVLLNPCAEYQRLLRMGKVARIAANFSEYIANEPKVSYRDGRYFVFDGQNTIEARKTCNGGRDLPIRCKVFYGLSKEHEALLFAVQTGISSELTAGEQLRAKLVAHEENACDFVSVTEDTGVRFALDGIRAPWKIYCIRSAYYIYKSYGAALYREMLSILVDAWDGDSDSFLSGILHGMARFLALYQGEYSRERLILRLRTVHPKTITRLAQNDTGNVADRHMKQMDKDFMLHYFNKAVQPEWEELLKTPRYQPAASKRDTIAREFFRMLNDEQKRKYLDLESAAISAECDIAEALYMKGAADREMMIR